MIINRNFEKEKEAAVNMFREIINTPYILEVDVHFHGEVDNLMQFEYDIKRTVVPETKQTK